MFACKNALSSMNFTFRFIPIANRRHSWFLLGALYLWIMRFAILSCALLALSYIIPAFAKLPAEASTPIAGFHAPKDAVILIIRHAEKPDSGPDLSPAGHQRAEAYASYFKSFGVDSKPLDLDTLYATADSKGSNRPRLTIEPLSKALHLQIHNQFKDREFEQLAADISSRHHEKRILICWHHGEIPELLRALGADPDKLLPKGKWPATEFGWVLQLCYDHDGRLIPSEARRIVEDIALGTPH